MKVLNLMEPRYQAVFSKALDLDIEFLPSDTGFSVSVGGCCVHQISKARIEELFQSDNIELLDADAKEAARQVRLRLETGKR